MGWIMSILLSIYIVTEMTNCHLLPVAVIFAILGTIEDLFDNKK